MASVQPREAFSKLTSSPTVTFGIASKQHPAEIVGPMNPRSVHYGVTYASDPNTDATLINSAFPTVFIDFNKYRPDLPPWQAVREIVLADRDFGDVIEYTLVNTQHRTTDTTGNLKTVSLSADGVWDGVDGGIIEKDEVAEQRGMGTGSDLRDSQSFKVNEELV